MCRSSSFGPEALCHPERSEEPEFTLEDLRPEGRSDLPGRGRAKMHRSARILRHGRATSVRLRMTEGTLSLLACLMLVRPAFAVCTQHGTVASTSTAIVGSNDVAGIEGRHYFLIQNTGTTNPMNVAIGSSNAATSTDLYLGPGASWVMTMQQLKMVPGGDVAAISLSGTTYSFCDW
jgi:hypothetical protein